MQKKSNFIAIFLVLVIGLSFASHALAYDYVMMEQIPGLGLETPGQPTKFPALIQNLSSFALWTIGIAALFMITLGGFWYMTSAGDSGRMTTAKEMISDALLGLVVVFIAYLLLYVINPDLVNVNINFKAVTVSSQNQQSSQITGQPPGQPCAGCVCSASKNSAETEATLSCVKAKSGLTLGQITTNSGTHKCQPPSKISCHYGGTKCNGVGNAIDFGGPAGAGGGKAYADIVAAAQSCGASGAYCEDSRGNRTKPCSDSSIDHIHVTVESGCGCS